MKPKIFISSTFYDLKYVREGLGDFINNYGYEAIRFEDGNIGYTPGKDLDYCCYKAMSESDLAILVIGGRYGSPASDSYMPSDKFSEYMSITRKEFITAQKANIPIQIFIEDDVYAEYEIYKKNKETLEKADCQFKFVSVDNINVHRFIEEISRFTKLSIKRFKEIGDIKNHLRAQWADMLRDYLVLLRKSQSTQDIETSIFNMYNTIQQMDVMVREIGEKLFSSTPAELKKVSNKQNVEKIANQIARSFDFITIDNSPSHIHSYLSHFIEKLYIVYKENLQDYPLSENFDDIQKFYSLFEYNGVVLESLKEPLYIDGDELEDTIEFKQAVVERLMCPDYLSLLGFSPKV